MTDRVCPRCGEEDCALERSEHETAMRDASSNRARCDCFAPVNFGHYPGCPQASEDALPNSVAEPEVQRGRDESLIPTFDGWDDEPGHTSPNSVSITVSEETADWITAKAMEHGCTEDEVIAKLIAEWDHPR